MAARTGRGARPASGNTGSRAGRRPSVSAPATRRTTRVDAPEGAAPPRRTSSFTSRVLVLLLVMAVLGVSYASSIRAWLNQHSEQQTLSAQIAAQRAAIAQLKTAQGRWSDPAYIEDQARLRFGWVMPGEHSYRVIGPDGKVLSAGRNILTSPLPAGATSQPPWWDGAARSLSAADSPPAAPKKPSQPARQPAKIIGPDAGGPTSR